MSAFRGMAVCEKTQVSFANLGTRLDFFHPFVSPPLET
jgi:hypothetical protein